MDGKCRSALEKIYSHFYPRKCLEGTQMAAEEEKAMRMI
jgi:hypothetical protein